MNKYLKHTHPHGMHKGAQDLLIKSVPKKNTVEDGRKHPVRKIRVR